MLDAADLAAELDSIGGLPITDRMEPLARIGRRALDGADEGLNTAIAAHLAALVDEGVGAARQRLELGEILGLLGDPRLHQSTDKAYWAAVDSEDGPLAIGRHLVTNAEYRAFIDAKGYDDKSLWTDEGWAWRSECDDLWPTKASAAEAAPFVVPNQPVVGVSWYEATAFSRFHDSRLPSFDERLWAVRGAERRPYPWGSPFGKGNANTREEVLGRPCAVGLYLKDRTPDGVCDLAGNVAEWAADGAGDEHWVHPGCWAESFESSWAKARLLVPPTHRSARLGFRLAR